MLSKTGPSSLSRCCLVPAVGRSPDAARAAARSVKGLAAHTTAAIYAFSALLALAAPAICLKGPLQGLGPVREVLPQGAMFAIICVLWAVANWPPVSLHFRGNTTLVLEDAPLSIGLAFLTPNLLVLSAAAGRSSFSPSCAGRQR